VRIDLLGPLDVYPDDAHAGRGDLAGARLRGLLIRLAIDAPRPVSQQALIDALWGDEPPADQANALQSLVSRLRRGLGGPETVASSAAGYRLTIEPDDVDVNRFAALARRGRDALSAGDPSSAADDLREALGMWRAAVPEGWGDTTDSAAYQARLQEQRLEATADLIEADLALGRHLDVVADLDALVAQHPLRERFSALLMQALAGSGRQADALAQYDRVREQLADELGVDPSPELQAAHLALLRGELGGRLSREPSHVDAARRSNVKTALTSFVGRAEEVARIAKLLGEVRLITLVGPGGAGKTRLASVAAVAALDDLPDGVWMAELAPVTDPADVPSAVLDALGLRDASLVDLGRPPSSAMRDLTGRLIDALAGRRCLLLLDNCEHVIDAAARLADELLAQCASLRIITTSREPLGIVGETLVAVPPLPQPATGAQPQDAMAHPAVALFADRAVAVQPDFVVDEHTVAPVVEIVRRLDGLPLAIELAAARLRSLPVDEIAARLSDRFKLLTGGSRTAMPRHRTLRAVVEWSWDLLTEPERLLAERLAVFAGTFSPADARAVCADERLLGDDVDDLLDSLVDKSLLQATVLTGAPRYRMLETLREFGLDQLAGRGEVAAVRRRHATRFAALVRVAGPHTRTGDQLVWMAQLEAERDNILAALRFLSDDGQAQAALELAIELSTYWMFSGRHGDATNWLAYALAASGGVDAVTQLTGQVLHSINSLASSFNDPPEVVEANLRNMSELGHRIDELDVGLDSALLFLRPVAASFSDDAENIARLVEKGLGSTNPWIVASVRMFRAAMAENNGDVATMRTDAEIALQEFRALGERWGMASCLGVLAQLKTMDGELDAAIADLEEAVALSEELGGHDDATMLYLRLADLRMRTGDLEGARDYIELVQQSSALSTGSHQAIIATVMLAEAASYEGDLGKARLLGEEALQQIALMPGVHPAMGHIAAIVLALAGRLSVEERDLTTAREHFAKAYGFAVGTRDMPVVAMVGVGLAGAALAMDRPVEAAEILGAAAALRGAEDATQRAVAVLTASLREQLGQDDFAIAYAAGRTLDRAAACARVDPATLSRQ
jgi:predicted ATPase/DNA-binding SARP family transcriptional activator